MATGGMGGMGGGGPEYTIELSSGLGGPAGRCRINWCRGGTCHFTCLSVPDDEESCNQAADAYSGVPGQNFIDVEFVPGTSTCRTWTGNSTLCQDEFGSTYYPFGSEECNPGDTVASPGGACFYEFCIQDLCEEGCASSDEPGCDARADILMNNGSITSSSTRFSAGGSCPRPVGGGSGGTGGGGSGGASGGGGDPCGDCLDECTGLPGCCTGSGCACENACMPSSCTPPYQLCCNAMFCLCLEVC